LLLITISHVRFLVLIGKRHNIGLREILYRLPLPPPLIMPSYDFSKYKLARVECRIFSPSFSLSFFYLRSFSVVFAPKRVSHPNFITFKKKVLNLEPQISPYFSKFTISAYSVGHAVVFKCN